MHHDQYQSGNYLDSSISLQIDRCKVFEFVGLDFLSAKVKSWHNSEGKQLSSHSWEHFIMFLQDNNSSDTGALAQKVKRAILTLALSEIVVWLGFFQILEESFKYGKVGDKVIEWDKDQRGELSLLGWKSTKFKRQMITFWFLSQFVCFRTFLV